FGCGLGQCGACSVLVDNQSTRSCTLPVSRVAGRRVTTLEGIGTPEQPDRVQAAFIAEQAAQCGYCTSGMIVAARALLSRTPDPADVDSFFAIHADGALTLYTGKVDIGTGLRIAVAQMAAEELGVRAERISVVDGDTGLCPDQGGTGGSTGLTRGGTEIRQAAATARQALLALGATRLGRPAAELTIVDGEVRPLAGGAGVGVGTLIGDRRFSL